MRDSSGMASIEFDTISKLKNFVQRNVQKQTFQKVF